MECLCRHFYSPTYHRDILTRTDHINLLATPKGYRWYGPSGELQLKARAFRGRSSRRKEREIEKDEPEAFPGMVQFMHDVWYLLTPDMLLCLREILVDEFDMTPRAAVLFLIKQYLKTQRAVEKEISDACYPSEEQVDWSRNIAGTLASKIIQYTEMVTTAKRSKRTKLLFNALLQRVQKAFGIEPGADTPLNQLVTRLVDGLAIWLSSIPGENNYENICSDLMTVYFDVPLQ